MSDLSDFLDLSDAASDEDKLNDILENFYAQIAADGSGVRDNCPAGNVNEQIVKLHLQETILNNGLDGWFEVIDRTDVQMKYDLLVKIKGVAEPFKIAPFYLQGQIKSSRKNTRKNKSKGSYKTSFKKGVYDICLDLNTIEKYYDELDFFAFYIGWVDEKDGVAFRAYSIYIVEKNDLIDKLRENKNAKNPNVVVNTFDSFWKTRNGNFDVIRDIALRKWFDSIAILLKLYGTQKTINILENTEFDFIVRKMHNNKVNLSEIIKKYEEKTEIYVALSEEKNG
jgi:hypothetical protein